MAKKKMTNDQVCLVKPGVWLRRIIEKSDRFCEISVGECVLVLTKLQKSEIDNSLWFNILTKGKLCRHPFVCYFWELM